MQDFIDNLNDDEYVCFVNSNIGQDFIKKALLHFKYLPDNFGIYSTEEYFDKFTFDNLNDIHNGVFRNVNFKRIFNSNVGEDLVDFEVYYI